MGLNSGRQENTSDFKARTLTDNENMYVSRESSGFVSLLLEPNMVAKSLIEVIWVLRALDPAQRMFLSQQNK